MQHFVTYFDSNYLTRGVALYRSLERHADEFQLWVICIDNLTYELLERLKLPHVRLVRMSEFEDERLLSVKQTRTRQEYCWTCTPFTVLYVFANDEDVEQVTYLDADIMFYSSPEVIFEEAGEASILLTEHRWLPEFDLSEGSGIYNVQFMTFKRDENGLAAAKWWRDRCVEWCFARFEDGKFGDQKYLDDWPERFKGVHVVENLGAGVAPWNCGQFEVSKQNEQVVVNGTPLVFYHFHGLKLFPFGITHLYGWYPFSQAVKRLIYEPYVEQIALAYKEVRAVNPGFDKGVCPFQAFKLPTKAMLRDARAVVQDILQGRYLRVV